ncbi:MAG: prepilin-type N-terminal cleavage/methylation domain-containing protein [Planctomycetota bacterium]|nr:prepilin-type N-terminal cleavage/methylation domain-containing protein [Planctomycetota bacterium]
MRRGFSLIEATIAAAVLVVLVIGALETLGATARARHRLADAARAHALAESLCAEVGARAFSDPDAGTDAIGPNPGDAGVTRAGFDDVDDYHALSEKPPESRDGVAGADGSWQRDTEVVWMTRLPSGALTPSLTATSIKRVTVTVRKDGVPLATRVVYRTRGADEVLP